jgi:hypothetical protein
VLDCVIAHGIGAQEVNSQDIESNFGMHLFEWRIRRVNPCVIDQTIDPSVFFNYSRDAGCDLGFNRDITSDSKMPSFPNARRIRYSKVTLETRRHRIGGHRIAIQDRHFSPLSGKHPCAPFSNPSGPSRNDDYTILKPHPTPPKLFDYE